MEEAAAAAAVASPGSRSPITPSSNSLSMSGTADLGVLVHFANERPDLGLRELANAGPQQLLVFGQASERRRHFQRLGRHARMLSLRTRTTGRRAANERARQGECGGTSSPPSINVHPPLRQSPRCPHCVADGRVRSAGDRAAAGAGPAAPAADVPHARRLGQRGRDRDRPARQGRHGSDSPTTSRSRKRASRRKSKRSSSSRSTTRRMPIRPTRVRSCRWPIRIARPPTRTTGSSSSCSTTTTCGGQRHAHSRAARAVGEHARRRTISSRCSIRSRRSTRRRSRAITTARPTPSCISTAASTTTRRGTRTKSDIRCSRRRCRSRCGTISSSRRSTARARISDRCARAGRRCST